MSYSLKLLPDVKKDIETALQSCSKISETAPAQFLVQLSETIEYLGSNPKLFPRTYRGVYVANISKSVFKVFFLVDETAEQIILIAIVREETKSII